MTDLPQRPPERLWWSVIRFGEMIRFSHTIFAMPFALLTCVWAIAVPAVESAEFRRWPPMAVQWIAIVIAMAAARSFAMTVNRIADRQIDAQNPRTAMRHLPAGLITVRAAKWYTAASAAVFIASCLLFLPNWLPLVLSGPVLLFLAGYSYAKRFTALVHFYLGAALAAAPICVWLALRGSDVIARPADILPAVLLAMVVWPWVTGFDLIYACQDAAFDRASQLHSIPARIGVGGALKVAAALHLIMLLPAVGLVWATPQLGLGGLYLSGVAVIAFLVLVQHSLVRPDDLSRVNVAFFQTNAAIGCVFLIAGGLDAWI